MILKYRVIQLLFVFAALLLILESAKAQARHYELGAYLSQYDICGYREPVGMVGWKSMKDEVGAEYLDTIAVNLNYLGVPWNDRPQWFEDAMVNYATWLRDNTTGNVLLHTRPLQRLDWMPGPAAFPSLGRVEVYPPRNCEIPPDASKKYADYVEWVTRTFSDKLGDRLKYFVHGAEAQSHWGGKIEEFERSGDRSCLTDSTDYHNLLDAAYDRIKTVDGRIFVFPSFGVEELYALSYDPDRDQYRGCLKGEDRETCAADNLIRASSLKRDKFGVAFQPFSHAHGDYDVTSPLYDRHFLYDNALEVFAAGDWLGAGARDNEGIVVTETAWNATEVIINTSTNPALGQNCWHHDYAPEAEPQFGKIDFYTSGACRSMSWPYDDPNEPVGSDQEQSDFFNYLLLAAQENPHVELITWWSIRDQIDTGVATRGAIAPDLADTSCSPIRWDNEIHAFRHQLPSDVHRKYGTPFGIDLANFGEATLKNWSTTGLLDYFGNDVGRSLNVDWINARSYSLFNEGTNPDQCFDAIDNDGDGLNNCDDPNCQNLPACIQLKTSEALPSWSEATSPDGRLQMKIKQMDLGSVVPRYAAGAMLYYQLERDGVTVLDWSPLGLQLANGDLARDLQPVDATQRSVTDNYTLAHGKRTEHAYQANESLIVARNANGQTMQVRYRVFDDGVAFRYELLGTGTVTITNELSAFRLPPGAVGYLFEAAASSLFQPGYESPYYAQAAGTSSSNDGFYFPALFRLPDGNTNVLIHEAGLEESYAGTRLDADATDRVYKVRLPSQAEGDAQAPVSPTATLPVATPWRVIMIGSLADIVKSNLVTHQSLPLDASFQGDRSWVRPGKAAWSWWSQGTQTPELQRQYIDSAAEFGWEYVIVDADWSLWPDADTEVPALVQYAAARGVRLLLWYNSGGPNTDTTLEPRDRLNDAAAMRSEFARLRDWGVAGVKVDFFRSDKQARILQYRDLLRTAAENRLHVVLHGSTPPRGWRREFPNLLTSEAVLGSEHYKWSDGPSAAHNVSLVFTRNVVGAMDYTPLVFDKSLAVQGITHGHQLALAVVYESALQTFADQADLSIDQGYRALFNRFPFTRDFLDALPVTWDDTRLLEGDPATHAVVARKRQGRWYIGGINAQSTPRAVSVNLSNLVSGGSIYIANIITDGASADDLQQARSRVTSQGTLDVNMAPKGGFVIEIIPTR